MTRFENTDDPSLLKKILRQLLLASGGALVIFTIFFGWLILGEVMTFDFIIAALLVISGLILINR